MYHAKILFFLLRSTGSKKGVDNRALFKKEGAYRLSLYAPDAVIGN
jgi:hypothetical protein